MTYNDQIFTNVNSELYGKIPNAANIGTKTSIGARLNRNLSDFSGYDLNMDDDDKDMLYEFIVGVDGAGNNHFAKALSDPKTLVKTKQTEE